MRTLSLGNRLVRTQTEHAGSSTPTPQGQEPADWFSRTTALQRGFSLFELIVVLVLISLAAALVMPSFSRGLKGLELETTGRDLITRMKHARSQAIAKQKVFRIILFQDENGPQHYIFADEFEQEIRRVSLPKGVSIQLEEQEFPLKISFYPNGRSSGATFVLRNEQGRRMPIWVDPITGFGKVIK